MTYVKDLRDLNEVRVADDLVSSAHLEHDRVVCASCQLTRDHPRIYKLCSKNIQNRVQNELQQLHPVTLVDIFVDSVDA